jgi:hypothetical protein
MTNEFVITVTDAGLPAQSAAADVAVVVVPPVQIQSLSLQGGALTLTWSSAPGNWYEIQVRDGFGADSWSTVQSPVQAVDFHCSLAGLPAHAPQQFFRVRILE